MKLNRSETHDRFLKFKKDQALNISQGAEDCLKKNSLSLAIQSRCPYVYIFAHPRTADDGYTKRMIWQPRMTKPKAQSNSYLFRAISNTDIMEICWLLPPRDTMKQNAKGQMLESEIVIWSYQQFDNNRKELETPHPEDIPEHKFKFIMNDIVREMHEKKQMDKIYSTLKA